MLFNSWQFAIFFPVVFVFHWALPDKCRVYMLFVASYYFYMSWNVKYVTLILFTTIISYMAGILLEHFRDKPSVKKFILLVTLISCLGVLFVFKYFNFFTQALSEVLNTFAIRLHPVTLKLLLPVGISFYTFQTLSYVIDVYRYSTQPEHSFIHYATFISFFPQLVAGPIERTNNLLPQIKSPHEFRYDQATYGIKLMAWGLFKKIAIADNLAVYVDKVYGHVNSYTGFVLVLATFFFAVQIYCDFSGYSDIARGCSKMLGIELMQNFRSPYFSSSIREFWSRWHISLSTWFRDYVYIPLGGNRVGKFRHYSNLMITFMISGLWHGANWTFMIWGVIHGTAQILEDALNLNRDRKIWKVVIIFAFTCCAWVFFRANDIHDALYVFAHSLDGITRITTYIKTGIADMKAIQYGLKKCAVLITILAVYDYVALGKNFILRLNNKPAVFRWTVYVALMFVLIFTGIVEVRRSTEFIYFQF